MSRPCHQAAVLRTAPLLLTLLAHAGYAAAAAATPATNGIDGKSVDRTIAVVQTGTTKIAQYHNPEGGPGGNATGIGSTAGKGGDVHFALDGRTEQADVDLRLNAKGGTGGYGIDGATGGSGGDVFLQSGAASDSEKMLQIIHVAKGGNGSVGDNGNPANILNGSTGGSANIAMRVVDSKAAKLIMQGTATGGIGGGAGDYYDPSVPGRGGAGGAAVVHLDGSARGTVTVEAKASSDAIDNGGYGGGGQHGGAAGSSTATAQGRSNTSSTVYVTANATGGRGGQAIGGTGSAGGAALATAFGSSAGGAVTVSAVQVGGSGGSAGGEVRGMGIGGRGADSRMQNAVGGSTSGALTLTQLAKAGDGGIGVYQGGDGGNALSLLRQDGIGASTLKVDISAEAGKGAGLSDHRFSGKGGLGGAAESTLELTGIRAASTSASSTAIGGHAFGGVYPGGGGAATAVLTLAGSGTMTGTVSAKGGATDNQRVINTAVPAGGTANARLQLDGNAAINGSATAVGGTGALYRTTAAGVTGSKATSRAAGRTTAAVDVRIAAAATGGSGGGSISRTGRAGNGGSVDVGAYGSSAGGKVDVSVVGTGGAGGSGGDMIANVPGVTPGGDGGTVALDNAAAGTTTGALVLAQTANGGAAGDYGGRGGDATSRLQVTDNVAASLSLQALAVSGAGSKPAVVDAVNSDGGLARAGAHGSGRVVDTLARAGGGSGGFKGGDAMAEASATGLLRATSRAEASGGTKLFPDSPSGPDIRNGGNAVATAVASSSAGLAAADAVARGGIAVSRGDASASAQAIGSAPGTSSAANATAVGARVTAAARSSAIGAAANTAQARGEGSAGTASARSTATQGSVAVTTGASAQVNGIAVADSAASVGGALPLPGAAVSYQAFSYAAALQASAARLMDGKVIGMGQQGAAWSGSGTLAYETHAGFTFAADGGEHLTLGLLGAAGSGLGLTQLALTVSNGGTELFARSFTSLDDAQRFFSSGSFDLGVLGGGQQQLELTAGFTFAGAGALSFQYAFGVSAVPEPGTWLLLLAGLALLAAQVWRRRHDQ